MACNGSALHKSFYVICYDVLATHYVKTGTLGPVNSVNKAIINSLKTFHSILELPHPFSGSVSFELVKLLLG